METTCDFVGRLCEKKPIVQLAIINGACIPREPVLI